jgi:hypothetical protein
MRVLVDERRLVADLLAGGPVEVPAGELVDERLRTVAVAVVALRTVRQAPTDEAVNAAARVLAGPAGEDLELEELRREGGLRRAA